MSALGRVLIGSVALAGLLAMGGFGVRYYGISRYDAGHAAAVAERADADALAILRRTDENTALVAHQAAANLKITEDKHEELAPVRERIVAERVRVGTAICGPASPAGTESAVGGDSANPPGRLVRSDAERDLVALKLAVEEDLATGRACQAFLRENGMAL